MCLIRRDLVCWEGVGGASSPILSASTQLSDAPLSELALGKGDDAISPSGCAALLEVFALDWILGMVVDEFEDSKVSPTGAATLGDGSFAISNALRPYG